MDDLIRMEKITKSFYLGTPYELEILHGIDLTVQRGEFIAIIGESGSGKSTLMNLIGGLDRPTKGVYRLDGLDMGERTENELSDIRNQKIGFVFQTFNLVPRSNALRNIELPMLYAGLNETERKERAAALMETFGMADRMKHLPSELSGGQRQRVAIARAVANNPDIILADEPTGALDTRTGIMVMDIFHKLHEEQNRTIILITHNERLARETQRILTIEDGRIVNERPGN